MSTRTTTLAFALALLPSIVLAADAPPVSQGPDGATSRIEVETSRQVPLNAYNDSVSEKTAHYCVREVCDKPPMLLSGAAPIYPSAALRAGIEGRAIVAFDIDASGTPVNLVLESATAPEFGEAAVAAIRAWRFQPAVLRGESVEHRNFRQSFPFEIRD